MRLPSNITTQYPWAFGVGRRMMHFHLHLDDPNFSQHGGRMLAVHIPGSGETQHQWGLTSLGHQRHCRGLTHPHVGEAESRQSLARAAAADRQEVGLPGQRSLDDAARQWVSPSFSQLPYFIHLCPLIYIYILSTRGQFFTNNSSENFPVTVGQPPTPAQ